MALQLVTTDDLRVRAFGLMPFIEPFLSADGIETLLSDLCLEPVKARLQEDLETYFDETVIRQSEPADGDVYDVTEPPFDYHRGQFTKGVLWRWRLKRRPVISVQKVVFQFSNDLKIIEVPEEWWRIDYRLGTLTVNPIGHSAILAAQYGAFFLPLIQGEMPAADLPQFTAIDYTAGCISSTDTTLPAMAREVKRGVLDAAYAELLRHSRRIMPQGSDLDGFRQNFPSIEQELDELGKAEDKFKAWWASHFRGPRTVML